MYIVQSLTDFLLKIAQQKFANGEREEGTYAPQELLHASSSPLPIFDLGDSSHRIAMYSGLWFSETSLPYIKLHLIFSEKVK